jgi:biotin operon repressor
MPTHKIYSKYAGIGNDVLQTDRISLKAKGLLGYLISKPEGWDFSAKRIASEIKDGREAIWSAMKELESDGLIIREKQANGRVIYHVYSSYELLNEPNSGNASQVKTQSGKIRAIYNPSLLVKKSVSESTHPPVKKSEQTASDIVSQCEPNLSKLAKNLGLYESEVRSASLKMAGHYAGLGKKLSNPTAMLMSWLVKDIEAGKLEAV